MNARQAAADRETRDVLLAIPEHMRPREAVLWLEAHGCNTKPAKSVDVTVTGTAGPIPRERRTAERRVVPAQEQPITVQAFAVEGSYRFMDLHVTQGNRTEVIRQDIMSPGWKMDFATRTLKRTRP